MDLISVGSLFAFLLGLAWIGSSCHGLYSNYILARKMGIPIRIIPIDHLNKLWLLVDRQVVAIVKRFPGILGRNNFTRFNYRGWNEDDRMRSHDEMGDVFVLVTPSHNWLYISDPDALTNMYRRGKDFPRWVEITKMLDVFGGPNIATASGEQWRRHRKIVQSGLHERCNGVVWTEAASLGDQMSRYWASKRTLTTVGDDMRVVSLNILCKACFGESYPFLKHDSTTSTSASASFRSSLLTIMENALVILALGPKFFTKPCLPLPYTGKILSKACLTFQEHMERIYNQKRRSLQENPLSYDSTLIASMARASRNQQGMIPLTDSEAYGTMFVVSFAGHDTTAHALTFAIFYLAANPHIQDWLAQELKTVLGQRPFQEWDYHSDFPKLKRCLSILYETLRHKTLVPEVKWTSDRSQTLNIARQTITIPPGTLVIPSYIHVHHNPQIWGSDSQEWKPERWIINARSNVPSHSGRLNGPELEYTLHDGLDEEILRSPPSRGSFLGWSEGQRDCPGKKFSHVEWVAIMASLFREWKVEPRKENTETSLQTKTRVLDFIRKNTEYGGLLLQLTNQENFPLLWTSRC